MHKAATALVVGLLLCSANLWGGDRCVSFTGTINASLVMVGPTSMAWVGEATFKIGNSTEIQVTTETLNTGIKKGGPGTNASMYIGTEETTALIKPGGTEGFLLLTRFVAQQMKLPSGVSWVNESGTIAPLPGATGKYKNVYGHFTLHGPFGPAVPHSSDGFMGWSGQYHGNICGIE